MLYKLPNSNLILTGLILLTPAVRDHACLKFCIFLHTIIVDLYKGPQ